MVAINNVKNTLQVVGSCCDAKLISPETIGHISQIAQILPAIPTVSEAGFECNLASSEPKSDFLLSFTSLNHGREALRDCCEPLANQLCANPAWSRIHDFCVRWTDVKSALYDNVDNVWLEFDVDGQPSEVPTPSFFFATKIINLQNNSSLTNGISYTNDWVTDEALRLLLGNFLPGQVKKNLLTCFNSLPYSGRVFQIGVMLPRQSESKAIRLCVEGITIAQILEYLRSIGWSGSISQLSLVLSQLSTCVDTIRLNFSVENTISPQIGFECYFDKQPNNSPKWQVFFEFLLKNQLCSLEKAHALLNWPGYSEEKCNQELWPSNFAKASAFVYPSLRSTFVRLLHHIKIVYQPNQPLQAKAYLWFSHRWLSPNGLFEK